MHKTFSQNPSGKQLHRYLVKHFPGAEYYCAFEAGYTGFWAYDQLEKLGIKTIVANPADIPTTDKERKQKEDRRDSRKIVKALRSDTLTPIRIPSEKNRQDRMLIRTRNTLVKDIQRNKNRIKGALAFYGITYPERFFSTASHWSKAFMEWLKTLNLGEESGNTAFTLLIENTSFLRKQLLTITRKIRALSKTEVYAEDVHILCTIPGIANLTSMLLLTELESIDHYQDNDHLKSYIGFIPSSNSSGDKEAIGELTSRGKSHLKKQIIESTWVAVRQDPSMMAKFNEACKNKEPCEAIVKVAANNYLNRIRFVLKNKKEYKILT